MKRQKKSLARQRRPTGPRLTKGREGQKEEKTCKHQWASLMAKRGAKVIPVPSAKICLKCGLLQVGAKTIRISRSRLDMGGLPIKTAEAVYIDGGTAANRRLKIPVGANLYS